MDRSEAARARRRERERKRDRERRANDSGYRERRRKISQKASRKYRTTPRGRWDSIVREAIRRAQERGTPYDEEYLRGLVSRAPTHCELTGLPFEFSNGRGVGVCHPLAPSLDQIEPGRGYTPGNVQAICWCLNNGKSNMTLEWLEISHKAWVLAMPGLREQMTSTPDLRRLWARSAA